MDSGEALPAIAAVNWRTQTAHGTAGTARGSSSRSTVGVGRVTASPAPTVARNANTTTAACHVRSDQG